MAGSPHNIRCVAVADTNFYRRNKDESIVSFRVLEDRAHVRSLASFLAASELLSHLVDRSSPDYGACRAAVRRLYAHCTQQSSGGSPLPIIADPSGILALSLFGRQHPKRFALAGNFTGLIRRVAVATWDDELTDISQQLLLVKNHRDRIENNFVSSLFFLRRQFGCDDKQASDFPISERPTAKEFLSSNEAAIMCASAMVMNAAAEHGVKVDDSTVRRMAMAILPDAAAAVHIYCERLRRILLEGARPERQGNFVWDIFFALLSGAHLSVQKLPVLLVTDDVAIQRASLAAGGGRNRVVSSDEYKELLSRWAIDA